MSPNEFIREAVAGDKGTPVRQFEQDMERLTQHLASPSLPVLTLYRTTCVTDWKGRPTHVLRVIGSSTSREELIKLQDVNVAEWQDEELEIDRQYATENELPLPVEWENDEKWEMDPVAGVDLRVFMWNDGEGNLSSIVYHIL